MQSVGKNKNLIGVSGKKGSGKDTFFRIFQEFHPEYQNKKFATKVKEICSLLTDMPIEYFYDRQYYDIYIKQLGVNIRELQQKVGTELFRNVLHPDTWIYALFSNYKNNSWIVTDVRFPNEANYIKSLNGILIRINRGSIIDKHESEIALDDYADWDYTIENNGTLLEFEDKIKNLNSQIYNL